MKLHNLSIVFAMMILTLTACGGGGDSSTPTAQVKTEATLKLSLTGTLPADTAIAGAGFTITLPASVTPEIVNNSVASSVIIPSGTFAGGIQIPPVYTAATAAAPGKIQLTLVNAVVAGVTQVGEVATVTLQITNGVMPSAASFSVSGVNVIDARGNPVVGMGAVVSGVLLQ